MRQPPLVDWDEATYAEVAHEAIASESYVHFTWNGETYLKKPPLLLWMVIGSFRVFGESAWAARLPSVAAGVGTLLLLYFSAAALVGRLAGMLAGLLPLGFYLFVLRGGRECATDGPLVFFNTLAVFALIRAPTNRGWLSVTGMAIGLAVLSKGLAGLVPLGVAMFAIALVPGLRTLGIKGWLRIAGMACVVIAPWLIYELITNGRLFWQIYVKEETLLRVASHVEAHREVAAATLPTFFREVQFLWVVLLPLAGLGAAACHRNWRVDSLRIPGAVLVWMIWLALELAVACAVKTKLGWYVLPALPPVALLCGSLLGAALVTESGRYYVPELAALAVALLLIEMPAHWQIMNQALRAERDRSRPAYALGVRAHALGEAHGDRELVFVGAELPTLAYYSGLRSRFVTFPWADFPDIAYNQVVLREPDGALATVGNLASEWNVNGPGDERGPTDGADAVCRGTPWKSVFSELQISLAQ